MRRARLVLAPVLLILALAATLTAQQPADVYQRFREWVVQQGGPPGPDVIDKYRAKLAKDGLSQEVIDREIKIIVEQGQRLEADRWNKILTSPTARFNREPNAFLVEMTKSRKPDTALDVGMGQGRNAIYLAKEGWAVTGFDPAAEAVALAQREAQKLGLKLTTEIVGSEDFDFGRDKWGLILVSYSTLRGFEAKMIDALKPGGILVVEAFHRDATKSGPIGPGVVYDSNELLRMFPQLRVVRYEDVEAVADFGLDRVRVVRLCAMKE